MESRNEPGNDILSYFLLALFAVFLYYYNHKKPNTKIDLHGMDVSKANATVDKFIDNGIHFLKKNSNLQNLRMMIITGRGLHSPSGIPRIKPAVISRLGRRRLSYWEINPGCLGVIIHQNALLTEDLIPLKNKTISIWYILIFVTILFVCFISSKERKD